MYGKSGTSGNCGVVKHSIGLQKLSGRVQLEDRRPPKQQGKPPRIWLDVQFSVDRAPLDDGAGNTSSRQEEEEGNNEPQEGAWTPAGTSAAPRLGNIDQQGAVVRRERTGHLATKTHRISTKQGTPCVRSRKLHGNTL